MPPMWGGGMPHRAGYISCPGLTPQYLKGRTLGHTPPGLVDAIGRQSPFAIWGRSRETGIGNNR